MKTDKNKVIISQLILLCAGFLFLSACTTQTASEPDNKTERIVTVGGSETETVYALGAENSVVGTDTSSIFPEAATRLPQIGYQRQLSSEGVLSLQPTLVLATSEAGTPAALQQIEAAGVKVIIINNGHTIESAKAQIRQIAEAVSKKERGEELVKNLENDLEKSKACVASIGKKPKILFIYARGNGAANVSGTNTAADAMIKLSGGENAIEAFEGYKPLTPESLVSAQPDVILMPQRGLESIGGQDGLLKLAGIGETPAGKNRRIITMDDLLLLGFGPRLGQAVNGLCEKLR